jgi:hypothetical protein
LFDLELFVRKLLSKYGAVRITTVVTIISIALSLRVTESLHIFQDGFPHDVTVDQFVIPVLVPLIVAPIASYWAFAILERLINAELEKERLVESLTKALENVHLLSGLLPICAVCKDIRDDEGDWHQIEVYISENSETNFSHGVCPKCLKDHFGEETTG